MYRMTAPYHKAQKKVPNYIEPDPVLATSQIHAGRLIRELVCTAVARKTLVPSQHVMNSEHHGSNP